MLKKAVKYLVLSIAILAFALCILVFTSSKHLVPAFSNQSDNSRKVYKTNKSYNILVMGDSLAKGTGDKNGRGFAGYFAESLQSKTSGNVKVNNIAVNGDVSGGLLKIVEKPQTVSFIKSADIIFMSIGGNEIAKFGIQQTVSKGGQFSTVKNSYLSNFSNIFKDIRNKNSKCVIVCIGLYNPLGNAMPKDALKLLNDWNYSTQDALLQDSNAVFIPTYDIFEQNVSKYLSYDKFHPNSQGYKAIANRIEDDLGDY